MLRVRGWGGRKVRGFIGGTTCRGSEAEPGLDPQGALLHPIVFTQELERSKPCWEGGGPAGCAQHKGGNSERLKVKTNQQGTNVSRLNNHF